MLLGSGGDDDVQMTLPDYLGFSMPHGGTALTSATRPRAAATPRHVAAPRPPHMAARQSLIGERTGPTPTKLGDGGASPPGTACSVPGKGADPRGGRGFQYFQCFPGIFSCPLSGVSIVWKASFPGNRTLSSPAVYFFVSPGIVYFGSAVRESDSVPTGQWFEPRLLLFISFFCVGFSMTSLFLFFSGRQFFLFLIFWDTIFSPPGIFFFVPVRSFFLYSSGYVLRFSVVFVHSTRQQRLRNFLGDRFPSDFSMNA